jgi:hypothetical protein
VQAFDDHVFPVLVSSQLFSARPGVSCTETAKLVGVTCATSKESRPAHVEAWHLELCRAESIAAVVKGSAVVTVACTVTAGKSALVATQLAADTAYGELNPLLPSAETIAHSDQTQSSIFVQ